MIKRFAKYSEPGDWYHITQMFGDNTCDRISELWPDLNTENTAGRRAAANSQRFFVRNDGGDLSQLFSKFEHVSVRQYFSELTGINCYDGKLRIELCQDNPGFYLEPHVDIPEKLITLQFYIGEGDRAWGTSVYDRQYGLILEKYMTVPFEHNSGWMSHCKGKVVHGVEPNVVDGTRKSVIINYVVGDWRDTDQLY